MGLHPANVIQLLDHQVGVEHRDLGLGDGGRQQAHAIGRVAPAFGDVAHMRLRHILGERRRGPGQRNRADDQQRGQPI
jgi:hypothetical protein